MSADEIVWEDPPAGAVRKGKWTDILAPFRAVPGQWGRLPERRNASCATNIRRGVLVGIEKDEFDARAVNQKPLATGGDGKADIYVRYIGKPNKVRAVS